jgi:hypothetical protein
MRRPSAFLLTEKFRKNNRECITFRQYNTHMTKTVARSPRMYFSPIIIHIRNLSATRPVKVRLFDARFVSRWIKIKTRHPDMPYQLLCSMLEKIQLQVAKTYLELTQATASQFKQPLCITRDGIKDAPDETINFELTVKRNVESKISTSAVSYKIGGDKLLPEIIVNAYSSIELSFFIAGGAAPKTN